MGANFKQQFQAILLKNIRVNFRSGATLRQLGNIAVMIGVVAAIHAAGNNSSQFIPIYMSLAIMMFCRGVALNWVGQRQSKQAQVQRIMGTSNSAYFSGWFAFFILNGIFLSAVYIVALKVIGVFNHASMSFGSIIGLYFLYMFASFSFVLFMSSFFSNAQTASQVITFVQVMGSMLYYLLILESFQKSYFGMQVTALLPSVCFQYIIMLGFSDKVFFPNVVFKETQGYITLGCEAVGYLILFLYLDHVLPNQNGSHKHPLFFLKCLFKNQQQSDLEEKIELANLSSARYFQQSRQYKKISMYLKDLTKSFDEKLVVNKLSLSLFQRQVFCLLGHNGAGKSTTINMLTGILQPDSGIINIFGYDYYTQMKQIRNKTGVCLQIDVLYDDLTVRDHIQYYAKIKGIPEDELSAKVDQMINKCGIIEQQNKKAKQLSGGNKRKTCLACASIGDSQLLFLDQPSSGLDPNSRKIIWGLINNLRQEGKTIILTTHHLQEAEALANRIGILAHGELLVLGSCHYIKEKFGCGYFLQISLKQNENLLDQKQRIRKQIRNHIKFFNEDDQVNEVSMRFQLPYNQQQNFSNFFSFLQESGIHFSLKLSSLQDIFIKIGIEPNFLMNNQPLPQLQNIKIPEYQPQYNFRAQFKAIFMKKVRTTLRSFSVVISLMLPIIFIIIGVVIAMVAFQNPATQADAAEAVWYQFYLIGYFMVLAFSFNTASYCGNIVKQRQIKFKYLSYVMGMKTSAYWVGIFAFDILMFWLPFGILLLVIGCFPSSQNHNLVNSFGWLILTLLAFSFSFLSFTYLWSFAFDSSRSAYRFYPFLIFLFFYIAPAIPTYISPTNPVLPYVLPIVSPLIGLQICMVSKQMIGANTYSIINNNNKGFLIISEIWYPIMVLFCQGILYLAFVLVLDNIKFSLSDRQQVDESEMNFNKSVDLLKEKEKISQIKQMKPIVVNNLYKKYPNGYVAIRDNSFIIEKGETFGLLGPNGAGKSTTFNILTAAIPRTHGSVRLNGYQVNKSVAEIFTTVGVCPQFNPLYDQLTVQQHIQFFAGMKGLSGQQKEDLLDFYIKNMQLDQYRHVKSHKLSGGNKRKLCVVMSLIGNPSLLFLDQPSAGVDPIARRYLWNVLHSSAYEKQRSIVMTTHSINEAQSLCDRIGILIKGEFYCIDSPLQLKKRYGKGYRAIARCDSTAKFQKTEEQVRKCFSNYKIQKFQNDMKLSFQFPKENFVFSKAFQLFYNVLMKQKIINQFQIAETTLEQVFIHLSKFQAEVEFNAKAQTYSSCCCCERNSSGCYCVC